MVPGTVLVPYSTTGTVVAVEWRLAGWLAVVFCLSLLLSLLLEVEVVVSNRMRV